MNNYAVLMVYLSVCTSVLIEGKYVCNDVPDDIPKDGLGIINAIWNNCAVPIVYSVCLYIRADRREIRVQRCS